MGGISLESVFFYAVSIVLNKIVDGFHTRFLRLGRVNDSSGGLFPGVFFFMTLPLQTVDNDQILVILLMILTIILFVLSSATFWCLRSLHVVVVLAWMDVSNHCLSESVLCFWKCHNLNFAFFLIGKWLLSKVSNRSTSSYRRGLTISPCQCWIFRWRQGRVPSVVIFVERWELDLTHWLKPLVYRSMLAEVGGLPCFVMGLRYMNKNLL